jgi:hypothetical protein
MISILGLLHDLKYLPEPPLALGMRFLRTENGVGDGIAPTWSQDNRYLVISNQSPQTQGELILVDLQEGLAYHLLDGFIARGWFSPK